MTTTHKFTAVNDEYTLTFDYGVNTLGIDLTVWDSFSEQYQTLFNSRMSGYCRYCGSVKALADSEGFDYDLAVQVVESLGFDPCQCD